MQIIIDNQSQTARPADAEGDVWYGLLSGTNGTGPAMRRALAAPGLRWVT